jgi:hypothetical protein
MLGPTATAREHLCSGKKGRLRESTDAANSRPDDGSQAFALVEFLVNGAESHDRAQAEGWALWEEDEHEGEFSCHKVLLKVDTI